MGEGILIASQIAINLAVWPLVVGLMVTAFRRRAFGRSLIPVSAVVVLLIATVLTSGTPSPELLISALWWFAYPIIPATYPDGRFVPRWLMVPVALAFVFAVAFVTTGGAIAAQWGAVVGFSLLVLTVGPIYRYLRRSTAAERESVRWAILGTLLCVESFLVIMLAEGGGVAEHGPASVAAANLAGALLPIGFAVGLLRPRILDVDVILRAVLAVTFAAPILGLCYLGTTAAVDLLAPPTWAAPLGAAVVAGVTIPMFRLAYRAANFLVFRGRSTPASVVAQLGGRLAQLGDARDIPGAVLDTLVSSLRTTGAALRGDTLLGAQVGGIQGTAYEEPVVYQGETIATLIVPPRRGESELTRHDREIIARVALHAAPALHGLRTLAELREAHAGTLMAREEERRRLRRDLHDDLSPSLAGLALQAAALERRTRDSTPTLATEAAELHNDIQSTVSQVREIAYGLRPPILDDQGLAAAIRSRAGGQHADAMQLVVEESGLLTELPAAVDLAALRIAQEAVSNVRRHSNASRCTVRLSLARDTLTVEVTDDGVGFPLRLRPGIGLGSIRDRAEELGGTATFGRAKEGGAAVIVSFPLHPTESGGRQ